MNQILFDIDTGSVKSNIKDDVFKKIYNNIKNLDIKRNNFIWNEIYEKSAELYLLTKEALKDSYETI